MAKFLTISGSCTVAVSDIVGINVHVGAGAPSAHIYYKNNTSMGFRLPNIVTADQLLRLCEIAENSPQKLAMSWADAAKVLSGAGAKSNG